MGAFSFSIPPELLQSARDLVGCRTFVETGTFHGGSSLFASGLFEKVITCEYSAEIRAVALRNFHGKTNIESHQGDSPDFLATLKGRLADESVCYWLDAHWCASSIEVGSPGQTRITEELEAIGSLNEKSVIFIDDARYYLAAPKSPNIWQEWPDLQSVCRSLERTSDKHFVTIHNDVICFVPKKVRNEFVKHTHPHMVDPSETTATIRVLFRKLLRKYGGNPALIFKRLS
jgi:hypothetical protein